MFRNEDRQHILVFKYAKKENDISILLDEKSFFPGKTERVPLEAFLTIASRSQFDAFIGRIVETDFAFSKCLVITRGKDEYSFSLFGILREGTIYVFAIQDPQHLFAVYEEFTKIINKQGRMLRESQKEVFCANEKSSQRSNDDILNDYMNLNNKLANMQRELTLKNRQISLQEKRFRDLFTFNPDALVVRSQDGSLLFMNPAAEHYFVCQDAHNQEVLNNFKEKKIQELQLQVNGQDVLVEVRCTDIEWDGNPARLVSFRDISQRRELERLKEDVERITKHDLKVPLSGMISVFNYLLEEDNIDHDQRNMLSMGRESGYNMLNMINRSLDLFKMEMGTYQLDPKPVDLAKVLRRLIKDSTHQATGRGVSFFVEINGDNIEEATSGPYVLAEEMLLHAALGNLLQNALEASPTGGSINISVQLNEVCTISITNQGGVPMEIRDSFFEKYTTSGKKSGTGLGTYSARLIIEAMAGKIFMESDGHMTAVTLKMPLAA